MNLIINSFRFIKIFILIYVIINVSINTDASSLQHSEYRQLDNINKESSSCVSCNIVANSIESIKSLLNELESVTQKKCTGSSKKSRDGKISIETRSWPPPGKYNRMVWGIPNKRKPSYLESSFSEARDNDHPYYRLNLPPTTPPPRPRPPLFRPNGYTWNG
ncbi:hypothetical protein HCN44_011094 [Aphidius gifuensis]|uniref:Uncharacterized protein n=1 Tax=Aphidius gifuensis TaxID=684658 RepID=A0A834XUS3_APHGI|nr:uncharacterized protein LOC122851173 [Aphidius gifuensis]KAF7993825.1 hypothetical protein HCN44_011094 [Aphidius gifuensis]